MKNVRFNAHKFLLVSLLSVTAFQAYGMEPLDEVTVTVSPENKDQILNTVSEWIHKLKNLIRGVEKRQDVTEHNVEVLGKKVHRIEGSLKNVEIRVDNLENKGVPQPTMVQNVVHGAKKIGTDIASKANDLKDVVKQKGTELKNAAIETGESVVNATKEKVDELKNGAEKLGKEIKKDSKTVGEYFAAKAKAAYAAVTGAPQSTYSWVTNNPGKAALIAVVATATIYLGYQWYKTTKKSTKRRVNRTMRNVTANTIVA